jgi:hypothetical protein
MTKTARRRLITVLAAVVALGGYLWWNQQSWELAPAPVEAQQNGDGELAVVALEQLPVKGRAPKMGYSREEFYKDWGKLDSCDMRNVILKRDLWEVQLDGCIVESGVLNDPYTGQTIHFQRGATTSSLVQIDHVVALSDAWQKGAQQLEATERRALSQDPLNLLAVDGPANQQKSDADAASWLPANKAFRCEYVARQIAVKQKYTLWVTQAEHDAMENVLQACPEERLITDAPAQR